MTSYVKRENSDLSLVLSFSKQSTGPDCYFHHQLLSSVPPSPIVTPLEIFLLNPSLLYETWISQHAMGRGMQWGGGVVGPPPPTFLGYYEIRSTSGGTHPPGMHSCLKWVFTIYNLIHSQYLSILTDRVVLDFLLTKYFLLTYQWKVKSNVIMFLREMSKVLINNYKKNQIRLPIRIKLNMLPNVCWLTHETYWLISRLTLLADIFVEIKKNTVLI